MTQVRILIVDDQPDVTSLLDEFLTAKGYQCRQAADGKEALKIASAFGPNIIVTDINMPGQSGIELLRNVKRQNPGLRVILMTGYIDVQNAIDAVNYGAVGFFCKPLELEEVARTIQLVVADIQQELKSKIKHEESRKENTRLRNSNAVLSYFQGKALRE